MHAPPSLSIIKGKSRPKSIHDALTTSKTKSGKTQEAHNRSIGMTSYQFARTSYEIRANFARIHTKSSKFQPCPPPHLP